MKPLIILISNREKKREIHVQFKGQDIFGDLILSFEKMVMMLRLIVLPLFSTAISFCSGSNTEPSGVASSTTNAPVLLGRVQQQAAKKGDHTIAIPPKKDTSSNTCQPGECVCVALASGTNKEVPITFWRGQTGHDGACKDKKIGEPCSSMWQTGTCARIDGIEFLIFEDD